MDVTATIQQSRPIGVTLDVRRLADVTLIDRAINVDVVLGQRQIVATIAPARALEITFARSGPKGDKGDPGTGSLPAIGDPDDGELHLTPKASSTGPEGTVFYCNADKYLYVGVD